MAFIFFIPSYYAAIQSDSLVVWFDLAITFVYILTLVGSIYITIYNRREYSINNLIRYFILLMIILAITRIYDVLSNPKPLGDIYFSVILMIFYAIINLGMCVWTKSEGIRFNSKTTMMQSRIFAMKFYLKLVILASLLGSYIFSKYTWRMYLDAIACIIFSTIAFFNYKSLKMSQG